MGIMSNRAITILICDDHAVVREGLRALISTEADMQVVGEAPDGERAISAYRALRPDELGGLLPSGIRAGSPA